MKTGDFLPKSDKEAANWVKVLAPLLAMGVGALLAFIAIGITTGFCLLWVGGLVAVITSYMINQHKGTKGRARRRNILFASWAVFLAMFILAVYNDYRLGNAPFIHFIYNVLI